MKRYEFTGGTKIDPFGRTLRQIRALVAISSLTVSVNVGDLGGWIEHESNLAQDGTGWVCPAADVAGKFTSIRGGTIEGGTIWGGTIEGGTIRGGTIRGGTIWGGTIEGEAFISDSSHLGSFSNVGSEFGILTWFLQKDRTIAVNRGCFSGTLDQFREAVQKTHGDNFNGQQYRLLIQFIEIQAAEALKTYAPPEEAAK